MKFHLARPGKEVWQKRLGIFRREAYCGVTSDFCIVHSVEVHEERGYDGDITCKRCLKLREKEKERKWEMK